MGSKQTGRQDAARYGRRGACRYNRRLSWRILILLLTVAGLIGSTIVFSAEPSTPALSPQRELASFRLADAGLVVELVAAEPVVVSPVAIAFDAEGRLFVAEMADYPNAATSGRIKLLEDRDGDGRYETGTVFADNLPFPNGVLPWKDGVLVTAAPNIWYLKDTDGDGRADERSVLFTGFAPGNQQLRVNGLLWGLDNWVYGANGRSEGEVRAGDNSTAKAVSIRGHDFRFRPDTGEFEAVAGRSQFGLARDDWGNRFLSWNTTPIRHEVLPERYLNRNPHLAATESVFDILEPGDTGRVFPLAPPPLTFNNESVKNFNALAGLTIYRGDALGEKYRGNAFAGESLLNLVHRRVLAPDGVTFVARRGEQDKEFLASTDPWFHPVNFATGPDGAFYVVDFYRRFVEHPDFVHGKGRNEMPWREGAEHGRIWRIRNAKSKISNLKFKLSGADPTELVQHLRDENGWWRDTAQRLLFERQERAAIPALEKLARRAPAPLARLHALHTLEALSALTPGMLMAAFKDPHPGIREHACRLSEAYVSGQKLPLVSALNSGKASSPALPPSPSLQRTSRAPSPPPAGERDGERWPTKSTVAATARARGQIEQLGAAVIALAGDRDARVRFQTALTLGEFDGEAKLDALIQLARKDCGDRWCALAILSSIGAKAWPFLKQLAHEAPRWLDAPTIEQARFLDQVARLVGASHSEAELGECLTLLTQPLPKPPAAGRLAALAGLADGLARSPQPLRGLMDNPSPTIKDPIQSLSALIEIARQRAASPQETSPDRLLAIRILARVTPVLAGKTVLDLLQPDQPGEIQSAAARALAELDDEALAKDLFARWSQFAAGTRRRVLAAVLRSATETAALAEALEGGTLSSVELDASARQTLLKTPNDQLKQRFKKILEPVSAPDRDEVVRRFQPALKLEGDRRRGAALFTKTCLLCHMVQGQGRRVGPDLSGIASRPKEALLVDILDPSRQVSPDFINYTLVTTGGKLVTGFIVSETAAGVTLRRAGEADDIVLRSQIKELRAEGKSLMPEGLEQGLTEQDLADLLSFLQQPEGRLLLEVK